MVVLFCVEGVSFFKNEGYWPERLLEIALVRYPAPNGSSSASRNSDDCLHSVAKSGHMLKNAELYHDIS